ncbi:MAG: PilZ domain-containing protein [Deltaproteobacteria bacterium]|nr:PilZ domain-containing protein [Deltaproteobacteria bacterium]
MKNLGFLYKSKERRLNKRHEVSWDAILEARFPDSHGEIEVKVVVFSVGGALLHSELFTVNNRHLFITGTKPELKLKISLPERVLELRVEIAWYNVLNGKSIFETGVSFINFKEEANISTDELLKIIEAGE